MIFGEPHTTKRFGKPDITKVKVTNSKNKQIILTAHNTKVLEKRDSHQNLCVITDQNFMNQVAEFTRLVQVHYPDHTVKSVLYQSTSNHTMFVSIGDYCKCKIDGHSFLSQENDFVDVVGTTSMCFNGIIVNEKEIYITVSMYAIEGKTVPKDFTTDLTRLAEDNSIS